MVVLAVGDFEASCSGGLLLDERLVHRDLRAEMQHVFDLDRLDSELNLGSYQAGGGLAFENGQEGAQNVPAGLPVPPP